MYILVKIIVAWFIFFTLYRDGRFKTTGGLNVMLDSIGILSPLFALPFVETNTVLILIYVALFVFILLIDIQMMLKWFNSGKLNYWYKWITYAIMIVMAMIVEPIRQEVMSGWKIYAFVLLVKWPLSTVGYSLGYSPGKLYIGRTHWLDKLLHKCGLVKLEKEKFPVLTFTISIMLFIAIFI